MDFLYNWKKILVVHFSCFVVKKKTTKNRFFSQKLFTHLGFGCFIKIVTLVEKDVQVIHDVRGHEGGDEASGDGVSEPRPPADVIGSKVSGRLK